MRVNCIVWSCHLLTVLESGDQSLSSVVFLFFIFHAVIIPWLFKKEKKILKGVVSTAVVQLLFR